MVLPKASISHYTIPQSIPKAIFNLRLKPDVWKLIWFLCTKLFHVIRFQLNEWKWQKTPAIKIPFMKKATTKNINNQQKSWVWQAKQWKPFGFAVDNWKRWFRSPSGRAAEIVKHIQFRCSDGEILRHVMLVHFADQSALTHKHCDFSLVYIDLRFQNNFWEIFPWVFLSTLWPQHMLFIFVRCRLKMILIEALNDGNKTYAYTFPLVFCV